jgi:ferredoxin hydrogenase large subunit/hydrogenase large subunit
MQVELGPVTRLEGHLNVKTTTTNGVITEAFAMGEMFRGFELILRGRDPLDAQQITQRVCGVCPYAHATASSYAQENAYGLTPPTNGRILHNLVQGANHLYDYILHFYHLAALDFVDVTAVLKYQGKDRQLVELKSWVKQQLAQNTASPAAPFLPRLDGQYISDTGLNIGALKHYLQALELQQQANQASVLFGGKFPHSVTLFPGGCSAKASVSLISRYQYLIKQVQSFILDTYIPDVIAVAKAFPQYWKKGRSKAGFLSFGLFPTAEANTSPRLFAPGFLSASDVIAGRFTRSRVQPVNIGAITEDVAHSFYNSASGLPVKRGDVSPAPGKKDAYSWTKAPRYQGDPMEVGPAARVAMAYLQNSSPLLTSLVKTYTRALGIGVSSLNSVLGRHFSRAVLAAVTADFLLRESERLTPEADTCAPITIPAEGEGFGVTEASRGALLHYIKLENHKIKRYELVVPTTWNISPRDDNGAPGPIESALIGTRVARPDQQIEAGRIIRSFDPCLACSVH